jgi:hypothetical protein
MPTCYTDLISGGIEFREFVMECSRTCGALVSVREGPIPERLEPSKYYGGKVYASSREIDNLRDMSDEQVEAAAKKEWLDSVQRYGDRIKEIRLTKMRYERMLADVAAWAPPTPNHTGLKKFMIVQIRRSLAVDCVEGYITPPPKESTPGAVWKKSKLGKLLADRAYWGRQWANELATVDENNKWLAQLRESLK